MLSIRDRGYPYTDPIQNTRIRIHNLAIGMVIILDGNSEHVAHAWKNQIYDCYRSNQIPLADQITEVSPYLRTYS